MFGCVWSLGATCDIDGRQKFDEYYKELTSGKMEEHPIPSVIGKIDCPIPSDHTVYDFMFEVFHFGYFVFVHVIMTEKVGDFLPEKLHFRGIIKVNHI